MEPKQQDLRLAALARFAVAITFFNLVGHFFLGFEQAWAHPRVSLRLLRSAKGMGNAYRAGIAASRGERVVLTADDLPFGFDAPTIEAWVTTVAWGSADDLRQVVRLARRHRLRWTTEAVPLADAAAAHDRLREGTVEGRLVLVP